MIASPHRQKPLALGPAHAPPSGGTVSEQLLQQPVVVSAHGVDRWMLGVSAALAILGLLMVFGASFFLGGRALR